MQRSFESAVAGLVTHNPSVLFHLIARLSLRAEEQVADSVSPPHRK